MWDDNHMIILSVTTPGRTTAKYSNLHTRTVIRKCGTWSSGMILSHFLRWAENGFQSSTISLSPLFLTEALTLF